MLCTSKHKIERLEAVQSSIAQCDKDEYTVGYYNGLEYAISVLTGKEPCYKMYEGGDSNEMNGKKEKKTTVGGYIKR